MWLNGGYKRARNVVKWRVQEGEECGKVEGTRGRGMWLSGGYKRARNVVKWRVQEGEECG